MAPSEIHDLTIFTYLKENSVINEPSSLEHYKKNEAMIELYSSSSDDMLNWLCAFDFSKVHRVKSRRNGTRYRECTPAVFKELLADSDAGFSVDSSLKHYEDQHVTQVILSHMRAHGVRWISIHMNGWKERTWEDRLFDASARHDQAIETLKPILGTLQLGAYDTDRYARVDTHSSLPIPYLHYRWRNYITPEFAEGRLLGDGTAVVEPVSVDVGVLPFVEMAERDRVQRQLAPLLPGRLLDPPAMPVDENFVVLVQAARIDGGIELPDDLRAWASSFA